MKKNFAKLLLISMVMLTCGIVLTACGGGGNNNHTHTWSEWVTTSKATCTADGERTRSCTDSAHTETAKIDKLGHIYGSYYGDTATCASGGKEFSDCTREDCNHIDERNTIMLGHDYSVFVSTTGVCGEVGTETYKCSLCEDTKTTDTSEVYCIFENWTETTNATCTTKAIETGTCNNCGNTDTREAGNTLAHDYTGTSYYGNTATCTVDGMEYRDCQRAGCGHTESRSTTALDHLYGAYYGNTATCTVDGMEYRDCQRAGCEHTESRSTTALDHLYGAYYGNTATCIVGGTEHRDCTRDGCGDTENRSTAALNHNFILPQSGQAATCIADGYTTHNKCSRCDEVSGKTTIDALGHNYGNWYGNTATCIASGTEYRDCARCYHTDSRSTSLLIGQHTFDQGVVIPPTQIAIGYTIFTCLLCGHNYTTDETPKLPIVPQTSAGNGSYFAVDCEGRLWAWGSNATGQLGLGNTTDRATPVQVTVSGQPNIKFIQISTSPRYVNTYLVDQYVSANAGHTLALDNQGRVWAWGNNTAGQVGNGNRTQQNSPQLILSGGGIIQIGAGAGFSIALGANGDVYAWGLNDMRQLGVTTRDNLGFPSIFTSTPYSVTFLGSITIKSISVGESHVLAITNSDRVVTWGDNRRRQASGAENICIEPMNVAFPMLPENQTRTITQVFAGNDHSFAIDLNGQLWAWGHNSVWQLGEYTTGGTVGIVISNPTMVFTNRKFTSVVSGGTGNSSLNNNVIRVFGIDDENSLLRWGGGQNSITVVGGHNSSYEVLSIGESKNFAICDKGYIWEWEQTNAPIFSIIGTSFILSIPQSGGYDLDFEVGGVSRTLVKSISAPGMDTTLIWESSNEAIATVNQSGTVTAISAGKVTITARFAAFSDYARSVTIHIVGIVDIDFVQTSTGKDHTLAIDSTGKLWGWGSDLDFAFGLNPFPGTWTPSFNIGIPMQLMPNKTFMQVSAGLNYSLNMGSGNYFEYGSHNLAIDTDGNLWGWGANIGNKLLQGNGNTLTYSSFTHLLPGKKFVQASAGGSFSAAIDTEGQLWLWGANQRGQLGAGNWGPASSGNQPGSERQPMPSHRFVQVALGGAHGMAIDTNGKLWTWGLNENGQPGSGTTMSGSGANSSITAGQRQTDRTFTFIAAAMASSYAIDSTGTLWAWGANHAGQLGDTTTINKNTPQQIMGNIKYVAGGDSRAFAIDNNGRLWSWGQGKSYQLLGDTTTAVRSTPQQVLTTKIFKHVSVGGDFNVITEASGNVWVWGANWFGQLGESENYHISRKAPKQRTQASTNIQEQPLVFMAPLTSVGEGNEIKLYVFQTGTSLVTSLLDWETSEPSIATVTDGVITGVRAGQTTITARSKIDPLVFVEIVITVN